MPRIKASEIGEYVYCERAWWLHQVVGETPAGAERRAAGTVLHARHGRQVWLSRMLLGAGCVLLLFAVLWILLG